MENHENVQRQVNVLEGSMGVDVASCSKEDETER